MKAAGGATHLSAAGGLLHVVTTITAAVLAVLLSVALGPDPQREAWGPVAELFRVLPLVTVLTNGPAAIARALRGKSALLLPGLAFPAAIVVAFLGPVRFDPSLLTPWFL